VLPGVPASLPSLPQYAKTNRLAFARWLVAPSNPLTARVAVNRYWQMFFGTGLVKTVDDFGSQGEWPTHPELLDWLATEFVQQKWSIKTLHKLIMTSSAYRQSSRFDPIAVSEKDPDNALLSRFPMRRMDGDQIRDSILKVSGRLDLTPFGPPEGVEVVSWYVMMGIGQALTEGTVYDDKSRQRNAALLEYKLQTMPDVPPISVTWVQTNAADGGPRGSKGVAEAPNVATAAAIANALAKLIGTPLRQLPMTPERIWAQMQEARS
jgi:hypothetical protein